MKPVYLGLLVGWLFLGAACSPVAVFQTTTDTADYAFVRDGQLHYVNQAGTVVPTTQTALTVQPVVLPDADTILFVEAVGDRYTLSRFSLTTLQARTVVPLSAQPNVLIPSFEADSVAVLVDDDLYIVLIEQQRMVRVHEGVLQAEFTASHQRIAYLTTDDRSLGRDFAADGVLGNVVPLDFSFSSDLAAVPADAQMAGWSRLGDTVYYVTSSGTVTKLE